ncbi:hypothetical protein ACFPVS_08960 [Neisseria weixii]|uniref:hypothetical protein n=1 Tax=Neisseria weixii TaxID=1853276 RepID=UPI000BB815D2|nr:hypothetical protein [Neisseria weixii]ATD64115.1 hypothetical protein CGZ65_00020 [Neisseria weixii]ATD65877.1 hypothetical protein CGZ65_12570 [Neisseria weixii]
MNKTTRLTQQDLQIYPSQRMTDTPDGGGLMTGTPLTGADNEIFPPVSDVDRTMGSFDARLLYPAVLRNDAEPLYGGHFIISEPPKSPNVSFLAFKARNYGEERQDIMPRIEAYSVPTVESRMTMMGRHLSGVRLIQAYQRVEAPLPKVGERYCLEFTDTRNSAAARRYEYFRIQNLESEIRTFEIPLPNGETKEIRRRVVKMEITNPLVNDYEGVNYPVEGYANAPVKILETQVADSASYYGVKPVSAPLKKGDAALTVSGIYEKLVPTSTVETAIADQYPVPSEMWIPSAPVGVVFAGYHNGGNLYFPQPVLPGSIAWGNFKDNAAGLLSDGRNSYSVDYHRGVIENLPSGRYTISGQFGAKSSAARYSTYVEVKETNQGTAWAPLLKPLPAPGALAVSFMALGVWYTLKDFGDGIIRDEANTQVGTVSYVSGSVILNLPAMPDVGSKIVFQWGGDGFQTFDGKAAGSVMVGTPSGGDGVYDIGQAVKPGTVRLSWTDGGAKTARDNGAGGITGDITGTIDYASGVIKTTVVRAGNIGIAREEYTAADAKGEAQWKKGNLVLDIGRTAPGSFMAVLSGSLNVKVIYIKYLIDSSSRFRFRYGDRRIVESNYTARSFNLVISDNGSGGLLLDGNLLSGGSIDYSSGAVRIPAASLDLKVYDSRQGYVDPGEGFSRVRISEIADREVRVTPNGKIVWVKKESSAAESKSGSVRGSLVLDALKGGYANDTAVFDTWRFSDGKTDIVERGGVLYKNWDTASGSGQMVGNMDDHGKVDLTDDAVDGGSLKITAGIVKRPETLMYSYSGRTDSAPVKPESFTVYAGDSVAKSDADGNITGAFNGTIDYETGFYSVESADGFYPSTMRYNAVTQDNLPLDSSIIGIDSVRLPSDGRVPIYRKGDMIVIGSHLKQDLGGSFTGGQQITLNRQNIDRLCLLDADGKHVLAEKYSMDLKTGELTFSEPLDLSQYAMPLTASMAWEEENRITGVDISGRLKLQFALSRDYPQENTYVSSALIGGDLLVRATEPFSQRAWDNVWADAMRGEEILAKLNVKDYPFKLTSNGAVTERWLIQFTGESQYRLYGEQLGLVLASDTLTGLAPANPATGKPYFRLPAAAFGGGWERGNCIRFNTFGTPLPVWVLRSVHPSPDKQAGRDGFTACLRGNTVAG